MVGEPMVDCLKHLELQRQFLGEPTRSARHSKNLELRGFLPFGRDVVDLATVQWIYDLRITIGTSATGFQVLC